MAKTTRKQASAEKNAVFTEMYGGGAKKIGEVAEDFTGKYKKVNSAVKTHGGKFYQVDKQMPYVPARDKYDTFVDGCCGGLTMLLGHDPRGKQEVANDKDEIVANFWRVMQNPEMFSRFQEYMYRVPFSRTEYLRSVQGLTLRQQNTDPVELAKDFFVVSRQSRQALGKDFATKSTRPRRGRDEHVSAYQSAILALHKVHERLWRLRVDCMPIAKLLREQRKDARAFVYLDPPYHPSIRKTEDAYRCEMTAEEHTEMLEELTRGKYMFMLCGYPYEEYEKFARDNNWRRVDYQIDNKASASKKKEMKTEVLWMGNYVN